MIVNLPVTPEKCQQTTSWNAKLIHLMEGILYPSEKSRLCCVATWMSGKQRRRNYLFYVGMRASLGIWGPHWGLRRLRRQESAGPENAAPDCKGGKCRNDKCRTNMQGRKMWNSKMRHQYAGVKDCRTVKCGKRHGMENSVLLVSPAKYKVQFTPCSVCCDHCDS